MATLEKELLHCEQCGAPMESSSSALGCLNCLLLGGSNAAGTEGRRYQHYEICLRDDDTLCELGRGAMGVTYRALDINLDAEVALKVISTHFSNNRDARERFRREARVAARLRHPNVASVYHFGETETHQCFYAMELIEGETLEARVRRDGPLTVAMALEVATQVARALMAASNHGLVHRDLKPSNLMIVANDSGSTDTLTVKVIDFGLARAGIETANVSDEMRASFSGTPEFASPEQFNAGKVTLDARSDIYSLGVTLWYLLCGKAPFAGGASTEFRTQQMHRQPPLEQLVAAKVPPPVANLLRSMLATDPDARPQSARELLDKLRECRETVEARPRRRRQLQLTAFAGLLLIATAFGLTNYFSHRQQAKAVAALPEKSVAVLPFENQSDSQEDAFFADGMQDEVLTSLVKIKELKVIGRSSVMGYRDPARRNLREIGQQLGVAHVLEGSVRRAGDRVLLRVSLIDTRDDHQLWAERFDRTLAGAITLQSELATEIAAVLQAKLAPQEKENLEAKSTENSEAYLLYLRARARETGADKDKPDVGAAEQLYEQAIALDPKFALACARASIATSKISSNFRTVDDGKDPVRVAKARTEANEAIRLAPTLGEAHLARALCFFLAEQNSEAALKELAIAETTAPNEPEIFRFFGAIYREQGRWRESIANYQRAQNLDPRNADMAIGNMRTYMLVRDWRAAAAAVNRAREIEPNAGFVLLYLHAVQAYAGDFAAARTTLAKLPADFGPRLFLNWDWNMTVRDFVAAEKFAAAMDDGEEKTNCLAMTALARGNVGLAHQLFETLRPDAEAGVRDQPNDAELRASLGTLYAYLGRKEDAIRESLHALDLATAGKKPGVIVQMECALALVYARIGETAQAISLIEHLLTTPGAVTVSSGMRSVTHVELRHRWEWDPLRSNPRFQKIVEGPERKTIY